MYTGDTVWGITTLMFIIPESWLLTCSFYLQATKSNIGKNLNLVSLIMANGAPLFNPDSLLLSQDMLTME